MRGRWGSVGVRDYIKGEVIKRARGEELFVVSNHLTDDSQCDTMDHSLNKGEKWLRKSSSSPLRTQFTSA